LKKIVFLEMLQICQTDHFFITAHAQQTTLRPQCAPNNHAEESIGQLPYSEEACATICQEQWHISCAVYL
jgi:hypothetical protein